MKLILENWRKLLKENSFRDSITKLRVFDFDETLATTSQRPVVRNEDGEVVYTIEDQAALDEFESISEDDRHGQYIDYEGFGTVEGAVEIPGMTRILQGLVESSESDEEPQRINLVLTARSQMAENGIRDFLHAVGIPHENVWVQGVAPQGAEGKRTAIQTILDEHPNITEVLFFDDSEKNLGAVMSLNDDYPDRNIDFDVRKVTVDEEGRVKTQKYSDLTLNEQTEPAQRRYRVQRRKAKNRLLDRGANKYKPKKWSWRKRGTTISAPPGVAESVEESAELNENQESDNNGVVVAIFGPSGGGKSTAKSEFIKRGFKEIKSFATRKPRGIEGEDKEYDFTTREEFMSQLAGGKLINVNEYDANSQLYGTKKELLEGDDNLVMLTDITNVESGDLQEHVKDLKKEIIFVYAQAPDLATLSERHRNRRNSQEYTEEQYRNRMLHAVKEASDMDVQVPLLQNKYPIYWWSSDPLHEETDHVSETLKMLKPGKNKK
jgi:guanylate kinase